MTIFLALVCSVSDCSKTSLFYLLQQNFPMGSGPDGGPMPSMGQQDMPPVMNGKDKKSSAVLVVSKRYRCSTRWSTPAGLPQSPPVGDLAFTPPGGMLTFTLLLFMFTLDFHLIGIIVSGKYRSARRGLVFF